MTKNYIYLSIFLFAFLSMHDLSAQKSNFMRSFDKKGYGCANESPCVLPELIPSCEWINDMKPSDIHVNTVRAKQGGTGTETDPFIVSSAAELAEIATRVNEGTESSGTIFPNGNQGYANQYFLMNHDIDLSDYSPWYPISVPGQKIFFGHFDGGNHTITNLTTEFKTNNSNQGLFSVIGTGASISNLSIRESNITGQAYTGAIVGACAANSVVNNCHNYCDVVSTGYYTGGIAGASWGTIENCTNSGNNVGSDFVGGIVGDYYGTITGCANIGNMSGTSSIGGIVGYSANISMDNCINSGNMTASGGYCGGVVGFVTNYNSDNTVKNCLNTGNVICSSNSAAAVIGRLWKEGDAPSHAENCYYDKQMTMKLGVYPGGDVEGVAEGKYTHEMIGNEMNALLDTAWMFNDGMYPCPNLIYSNDIAIVTASPANLDYKSDSDFDKYNSLTADFQASNKFGVVWTNVNPDILSIDANNYVTLMGLGTDTLYAGLGNIRKNIVVTVIDYLDISDYQFDANINVYPNPASDIVCIENINSPVNISIVNINDQVVRNASFNGADKRQVDISGLANGIYFIKMTSNDNKQIIRKVVVNH